MGVRHPERLEQILARTPRRTAGEQSELRVGFEVEGLGAERPREVLASFGFGPRVALQAGKQHERSRVLGRPFENLASEAPGRVRLAAIQRHPGQPEARRGRLPIRLEGAAEARLREVDLAARERLFAEPTREVAARPRRGEEGSGRPHTRRVHIRQQQQSKSEAHADPSPEAAKTSRLAPARLLHHQPASG
jgi:hypothetical protein